MKLRKIFKGLPDPKTMEMPEQIDIESKKEILRQFFPAFNAVVDELIRAKWTGPKTDKRLSQIVQAVGDIIDMPGMGGFDDVEFKVKDEWQKIRFAFGLFLVMPCIVKGKGRRIMALVIDLVDDILDNHVEE